MIDPTTLVALSVSAPAPEELAELGLSDLHVRYAFTELVRHVLAEGGSVAYGGRLDDPGSNQPNFTTIMLDMVAGYRDDLRPARERLVNFAAAAFWRAPDGSVKPEFSALKTGYEGYFDVVQCSPDLQLGGPADPGGFANALSFTAMREQMADQCDARVVLGGRLSGYGGRYPGVVEEAISTARAGKALFVVGGFGGCGAALAAHLGGEPVAALTQRWQHEHTPALAELGSLLADTPYRLDLEAELAETLPSGSWATLGNGLDDTDNERLAMTTDVDEIVALVRRGLRARPGAGGG